MTAPRRLPPPPTGPPTPSRLADLEDFERLSKASFATIQRSAESWRTAAIGLLGLGTTGVVITGPDDIAELSTLFRVALVVLFVVGFGAACRGIWQLLNAAAGVPRQTTLPAMVETYGSVRNAEIAAAVAATRHFTTGRRWVVAAIGCLIAGLGTWWAAEPEGDTVAPVSVLVGAETVCGELTSGDGQELVVDVAGEREPRVIAFEDVDNLFVESTCG